MFRNKSNNVEVGILIYFCAATCLTVSDKTKHCTLKIFISLIIWIITGVTAILFFMIDILLWILTAWWDRRLWVLHRYSSYWALFYIWCNPLWRIDISGLKNLRPKQAYVIVSNHQSALDILLLYRLLTHFKWVAKKELFRVPIIGWNLWLNRYITIDRNSPRDAIRMIKLASEHLNMGSSVLLFAEGTRTSDGRIKRFKEGAFLLAKKTSYPILPVVIEGTLEALPKNGFIISGRQTFRIRVLPEIPTTTLSKMEPSELAKYVHNIMLEKHKEMAPNYYPNS